VNKTTSLIILILLNVIALLTAYILLKGDPLYHNISLISNSMQIIERNFVDDIDPEELFNAASEALKEGLDPFTGYIPPQAYQYYEEESQGEFYGIGVEITVRDGLLTVISPIAGTPADQAGLRAGDQVTMIDDIDAATLDPDEAIDLIRGEPGTLVELKIRRPGLLNDFSVRINRAAIRLNSVDYAGVVDSIGYIRLTRFALTSFEELINALEMVKAQGINGLVMDLRGNPGGFLEVAVAITGLFLPKNVPIVSTRGKSYSEDYNITNFMNGEYQEIPMVVLINGGSASASEIFSGAMQDYDRAVLIGDTTFGKGLVQNIAPMPDNGAFRITVSKYYLPSGRIIQKFSDKEWSRNVSYSEDQVNNTYYTQGGREVKGGGGVIPDIIMVDNDPNLLEAFLIYGGFYFDFVVEYKREKGDNVNLPLDISILDDFKEYLYNRGFYTPDLIDNSFQQFLSTARNEGADLVDAPVILRTRQKIAAAKSDQWEEIEDKIMENLSRAISRVIYNKSDRYQYYELRYDPQIRKAFQLLKDSVQYHGWLGNRS